MLLWINNVNIWFPEEGFLSMCQANVSYVEVQKFNKVDLFYFVLRFQLHRLRWKMIFIL